ncbi:MAG: sulfatase [Planctomycetota bacterium]
MAFKTFFFVAAATFLLTLPNKTTAAESPNVLLILMDDMGVVDLSVEGSQFYRSPRIDQIAKGGMRFTQGYATCCVCSPSRASIQLGTFAPRHGITDWIGAAAGMNWKRPNRVLPSEYVRDLPADQTTIAEAFQEAGYATFFAGKWHLGSKGSWPEDHGYQINVGGHDRGSPPGGYFAPYDNPRMKSGPDGESLPMRLADETASFIRRNNAKPFFAMLSFYSVHGPVQTTKPLWNKYRSLAPTLAPGKERFKIDRTMPVRQVQDHPVYAGMVETVDSAIGTVLDELASLDLIDNTIVVFTSDNGGVSSGDAYCTSNLPYRGGKGRQWEGGIREPFYIHYPPRIQPGSLCDVPVTGADLYPTLLELCGLPLRPEQHLDGVSLVPLLQGKSIADRPLYWHYPHYGNQGGEPHAMIRRGPWKLIHYYEDGRNELYNVITDIGEQSNVALTQPATTAELWNDLDAYLKRVGANRPKPDARYDPKATEQFYRRLQTQQKERLEDFHAKILTPDWEPNPNWWGSLRTID